MGDFDQYKDRPVVGDIPSRVAVLEASVKDIHEDMRDIRFEDLKGIKAELRDLHDEFTAQQRGMSRPEKIALAATGSSVVLALLGVVAFLSGGAP